MPKNPAFLFYPKDWLQGTSQMMPDEKGVYIDLLSHQHQDGDIPSDTKRLARMVGLSEEEFLRIWEVVRKKFVPVNRTVNRLVNLRLTEIVLEREGIIKQNNILSALAVFIKNCGADQKTKDDIKKTFRVNDFLNLPLENIQKTVTEWLTERLTERTSIGNTERSTERSTLAFASAYINTNTIPSKEGTATAAPEEKKVVEVKTETLEDVASFAKKNSEPKKKVARKKKGRDPDSEPYWQAERRVWVEFNLKHLHFKVEPIPKADYSFLHRIVEKIRERATDQGVPWTEPEAVKRLDKFLTAAYTGDKWLHDHFELKNLTTQMQSIFKLSENGRSNVGVVGKTITFDKP